MLFGRSDKFTHGFIRKVNILYIENLEIVPRDHLSDLPVGEKVSAEKCYILVCVTCGDLDKRTRKLVTLEIRRVGHYDSFCDKRVQQQIERVVLCKIEALRVATVIFANFQITAFLNGFSISCIEPCNESRVSSPGANFVTTGNSLGIASVDNHIAVYRHPLFAFGISILPVHVTVEYVLGNNRRNHLDDIPRYRFKSECRNYEAVES